MPWRIISTHNIRSEDLDGVVENFAKLNRNDPKWKEYWFDAVRGLQSIREREPKFSGWELTGWQCPLPRVDRVRKFGGIYLTEWKFMKGSRDSKFSSI
jgi:hypothetical protein